MEFFSTPFDEEAVTFLDALGVPCFKISSGDLTHGPLLRRVAATQKPVLLSTGMGTLGEIDDALRVLYQHGTTRLVVLHCVSQYPALLKEANLSCMWRIGQAFQVLFGFSDHTTGYLASVIAVALRACVIEKHFTLDTTLPGPDHSSSLDPTGFQWLVESIRLAEEAIGDGRKQPVESEHEPRRLFRRSLVTARDIEGGEVLGPWNLTAMRPADGISPMMVYAGFRARHALENSHRLAWKDLA